MLTNSADLLLHCSLDERKQHACSGISLLQDITEHGDGTFLLISFFVSLVVSLRMTAIVVVSHVLL